MKLYPTRPYYHCEIPRKGDIINMIPEDPFGACLVVNVHDDRTCDLVRPHTKLWDGQLTTGYETVSKVNVFHYEVYTTGHESGGIDNRMHGLKSYPAAIAAILPRYESPLGKVKLNG